MNKRIMALLVMFGAFGVSTPAHADQTGNCTQGTQYCESVETTTTTTVEETTDPTTPESQPVEQFDLLFFEDFESSLEISN